MNSNLRFKVRPSVVEGSNSVFVELEKRVWGFWGRIDYHIITDPDENARDFADQVERAKETLLREHQNRVAREAQFGTSPVS